MNLRTAAVLFASLSLFGCAFDSPASSETGSSTRNLSGSGDDDDDTGGESADGAKSTPTAETAGSGPLDGTWDITTMGGSEATAAMMMVKGGHITGTIVRDTEGTTRTFIGNDNPNGCFIEKDRTNFEIEIVGDHLQATFQRDYQFRPEAGCEDAGSFRGYQITGTRDHADKNATGATALEGDWVFIAKDGDVAVAVTVAGLVAKIWDNAAKLGTLAALTTLSGNDLKSASNTSSYRYAARKR